MQARVFPCFDEGDFKVIYSPVKNPKYAELQKELKDDKVLEAIAAELNSTIALPVDITITFAECGQVNAFYDPNKQQISMCYELVDSFHESFSKVVESEDKLEEAVLCGQAVGFLKTRKGSNVCR